MTQTASRIVHAFASPFRLAWQALNQVANLSRQQIRSLVTVAFLLGMMSLSAENWALTFAAQRAAAGIASGMKVETLFGFITERMRYTSGLQFWLALALTAVILNADRLSLKAGNFEAGLGKGNQQ